MKRIIVDIDNTLWDFASVFQERIKEVAPEIPPVNEWEWDFYMEYISIEELSRICNEIHREQDLFTPFPASRFFLNSLLDEGYQVIIASHRDENSRAATERFMQKYNLPYTGLHLSNDKTILFDTCRAIVDDAPHLLDEAKKKGLICTGLLRPWNKNSEHPLFNSLEEVLDYLLKELNGGR
ncbi:MAG: hypothetical protein IBX72_09005 [Nitrospirae bacterium]|nr:hypothetical protein [Nitrospirota bacterium]